MSVKRLRVFAGPNGSGKSTLFETIHHQFNTGLFINADVIEKAFKEKGFINLIDFGLNSHIEDFKTYTEVSSLYQKALHERFEINIEFIDNILVTKSTSTNSYEAAFVAGFLRQELIKSEATFSIETVLSHSSKIEEIKQATKAGYKIYLYYISVESPIISQARVATRVAKGGHPVDPERINSRYYQTLDHLAILIPLVYRAYFFDNSGKEFILLAERLPGGSLKEYVKKYPEWFHKYVIQKLDF